MHRKSFPNWELMLTISDSQGRIIDIYDFLEDAYPDLFCELKEAIGELEKKYHRMSEKRRELLTTVIKPNRK